MTNSYQSQEVPPKGDVKPEDGKKEKEERMEQEKGMGKWNMGRSNRVEDRVGVGVVNRGIEEE